MEEKIIEWKKIEIALSGSMIALSCAALGYQLFGFTGGLSFCVLIFGIMWFAQVQLENAMETIEIHLKEA
jgi:anaerobic C4-dicarboxylate transporter